jgi:hypothetical protein
MAPSRAFPLRLTQPGDELSNPQPIALEIDAAFRRLPNFLFERRSFVDARKRLVGHGHAEELAQRLPSLAYFIDQQPIRGHTVDDGAIVRPAEIRHGVPIRSVPLHEPKRRRRFEKSAEQTKARTSREFSGFMMLLLPWIAGLRRTPTPAWLVDELSTVAARPSWALRAGARRKRGPGGFPSPSFGGFGFRSSDATLNLGVSQGPKGETNVARQSRKTR